MKIEDLKVGNLYKIGEVEKTLTFEDMYDFYESYTSIEPIPLTEEKLVNMELDKLLLSKDNKGIFYWVNGYKIYFEFVHKLQNFYYELFSEELTINN